MDGVAQEGLDGLLAPVWTAKAAAGKRCWVSKLPKAGEVILETLRSTYVYQISKLAKPTNW